MNSATHNRRGSGIMSDIGRRPRGRRSTNVNPGLEALDGRRLLSTVIPGAIAVLSVPPATAVANAAVILNNLDPTNFGRLQSDLARAEGHSHVSQAQVGKLAGDETALDGLVESAGLDASATVGDMNHVQDAVDEAFHPTLDRAETWAKDERTLEDYLADVPGSTPLIKLAINEVHIVARAARVSGPIQRVLSGEEQILTAELGPNPDSDLGPGAVDRDPLEVYYNGQVGNFVRVG
jgi:hypothetical protein